MFRWLLLFVLVVPALEIGVLVWIGGIVGPWWVILLIILTGVLGAWLAKQQGIEALHRARQSVSMGQVPHDVIFDGLCILIGAAFLLTPGFITDTLGFILLIPYTRNPIKHWMQKMLQNMMKRGTITIFRR
ncbi:membrane protein FxsA [Aquibacillus sp. 3ASR75-11]|uniref:Membrane protein FxsA n=1 Tax=Terrihalobacillus insolitus TaxID=2950438 RepID=A0A9X4AMY6_9BACI|nr:FxsA family protein [Terrihalobacillus insolitus]MDC3412633.1 membrane protein FxsA [Terrihalobacillus insolitus]MDC3423983.1 membrane protein FxsA [Terrihalobacillus insolitus]